MPKKVYSSGVDYEKKLATVMTRLGVDKFNYDWTRRECWIDFVYKGQAFRFEYGLDKAKETGTNLTFVSDCFARLVLSLEALARLVEYGIYDLQTWVSGMKALPEAAQVPACFTFLQFTEIPAQEELDHRYKTLAKVHHPDVGGDATMFHKLQEHYREALEYLEKGDI